MTGAEAEVARVERASTVHETPCTAGHMVWHEWGAGPPLVLLHGGFGSWMHWIRNVEVLARRFRVLAADIPGLGGSADAPEPTTPGAVGTIVADGLRALIGDTPFHIAGFSFGGLISGQVCLQMGAQARTLTLVGASGMGLARPPMELLRRHDGMSEAERMAALRHNLNTLMLHHAASIDPLALYIQQWNDARSRVRSRRLSLGDSLARALPAISARLVGIWGELDATAGEFLPLRRELMQASHPETRFEVIENAGHWVSYEAAEAFNRVLQDCLDAPTD